MRETRIPRLLGVKNYLNNYLAYKRLTRSRIRVEIAPHLLGVWNYFANKRLTLPRIRVKLATPAYLGLGIIFPINV